MWKAIARSAIGTYHQRQSLPCQDYANYSIFKDVIVGAIADGAGSALYSKIGANLVVENALKQLSKIEPSLKAKKRFFRPLKITEAEKLFTETVKRIIKPLSVKAKESGWQIEDLACTLSLFIATPYWVAAMQIGDGFIVLKSKRQPHQLLFEPDKGEYFNETTFITSADALDTMQVCVKECQPEFICAATDGLEKVAIRLSDWTPFPPFFTPLEAYLQETSNPETDDKYLIDFLNSERLNVRTHDDKTLLLCGYSK